MDAVIVWTDTEGKEYRSEKLDYLNRNEEGYGDISEGRGRKEFMLTLAGAVTHLKGIGRIFAVSPYPQEWMEEFFRGLKAGKDMEYHAVSYQNLFKGFEGFLPSFSESSGLAQLYRIPSLEEKFLVMSTGCIPIRDIGTDAFMEEDAGICFGKKVWAFRKSDRWKGITMLPLVMTKKSIEECFAKNPGMLTDIVKHEFDGPRSCDRLKAKLTEDMVRKDIRCGPRCVSILPGNDQHFASMLGRSRNADIVIHAPMQELTRAQKAALTDFLCMRLEIHLP